MLHHLAIRNFILIDNLDLNFGEGLCVLTGETGAGKSILLDALGMALGNRANKSFLAKGKDEATIIASFELPSNHAAMQIVNSKGFISEEKESLILRRILKSNGKSQSYVNEQPVTRSFLKQLGETLVEIEGQSSQYGLLNPSTHIDFLDSFGGHDTKIIKTSDSYSIWKNISSQIESLTIKLNQVLAEEEYLSHVCQELDDLDPKEGEETKLNEERAQLRNSQKILGGLTEAQEGLIGEKGAIKKLQSSLQAIERIVDVAPSLIESSITSLNQALIETIEAEAHVTSAHDKANINPQQLETIEDRLYALRAAARKHKVTCDYLPQVHKEITDQLASIKINNLKISELKNEEMKAREEYEICANELSKKRQESATTLDSMIAQELPALKLKESIFETKIEQISNDNPIQNGKEKVRFTITTNKGGAPGPLDQVASGGERSRFLLALKVCLINKIDLRSLVFDEVDNGVGGAVADAVGKRLAKLAESQQVLVITHSPQVAAQAKMHIVVDKKNTNGETKTSIKVIDGESKREEIARMLSGEIITPEARAAADSLIIGRIK